MPRLLLALSIILALAALSPIPTVLAHHTFLTKYDSNKLITVSGTIRSVSYANPHIFFDLKGRSRSGSEVTWRVETEGILAARAKGLTQALLKEGVRATVTGWAGRDNGAEIGLKGIRIGNARTISMRKTAR